MAQKEGRRDEILIKSFSAENNYGDAGVPVSCGMKFLHIFFQTRTHGQ